MRVKTIPTRRVRLKKHKGHPAIIAVADFDPELHEAFVSDAPPPEEPKEPEEPPKAPEAPPPPPPDLKPKAAPKAAKKRG